MRDNFIKNCYKKILAADSVYDIAIVSPTQFAPKLSSKLDNNLFIKREDLQPVFSFKLRGAYNKISKLKNIKHIVAASAGNHAQGVAMTCQKLRLQSSIVMPLTTPTIKVNAVKNLVQKSYCLEIRMMKHIISLLNMPKRIIIILYIHMMI